MKVSDLFLRGDVQVLQAGVEQQSLVDTVPCDFSQRSAVHLRVGREVHLQYLRQHTKLLA